MKTLTLDNCIAGCRKNHRQSQETVYKYFAGRMLTLCRRYTNNTAEAEDIMQEGFVKVFMRINTYTGEGSFEGWIKRIMVNTALSSYRSNQRRVQTDNLEQFEYAMLNFTQTHDTDDAEHLYDSLNKLPLNYRTAFNLFAIEGYSHHEIAVKMGISVEQSRVRVCRARTSLRASVGRYLLSTGLDQVEMSA